MANRRVTINCNVLVTLTSRKDKKLAFTFVFADPYGVFTLFESDTDTETDKNGHNYNGLKCLYCTETPRTTDPPPPAKHAPHHAHVLQCMPPSPCMPLLHYACPLCHTHPVPFAMHAHFATHAPFAMHAHPLAMRGHLWTEFLTQACKNITFPQLLLRTVIISPPPIHH